MMICRDRVVTRVVHIRGDGRLPSITAVTRSRSRLRVSQQSFFRKEVCRPRHKYHSHDDLSEQLYRGALSLEVVRAPVPDDVPKELQLSILSMSPWWRLPRCGRISSRDLQA